jgi:predicted anti-sigma-YlaC factor YlaD
VNCEAIQKRLQDLLEGRLDAAARLEVESHLAGCVECATVIDLLRLDLPEGAPDLTASVLERTTGSACNRAHELLCNAADRTLGGIDAELLNLHLDSCAGCTALATALEMLSLDLPAMAEVQPPVGFTESVLAATTGPVPMRWAAWGERMVRGWAALVQRPRIAWEAGYVGAVAIWLLVSTVGLPFQAAAPLPLVEDSTQIVDGVKTRVTTLGRRTWNGGVEAWHGLQAEATTRFSRGEETLGTLRDNGLELKQSAVEASSTIWSELTTTARSTWDRLSTDPETPEVENE